MANAFDRSISVMALQVARRGSPVHGLSNTSILVQAFLVLAEQPKKISYH